MRPIEPPTDEIQEEGSRGHKLGQRIGDWWEEYFVLPLLERIAGRLDLYLDTRFHPRLCRTDKLNWVDVDGNQVDYDFVLELGGSDAARGVPVAFLECSWRRGNRHSKDKARDDTGKLRPMRETYPTARFLGTLICGDFTKPAKEYFRNNNINLFHVSKDKIIQAFRQHGFEIDYADSSSEAVKREIATKFEQSCTQEYRRKISGTLVELVGRASVDGYVAGLVSALAALPQEIRFIESFHSLPVVFESIAEATLFLNNPQFNREGGPLTYRYEVTYSDGTEFEREVSGINDLRTLHDQVRSVTDHMERLARRNQILP